MLLLFSCGRRMRLRRSGGNLAVTDVAPVITVREECRKLPQVALPDRLAAQSAERLRLWCPAIHQDEFHVPPPNEKQNTVSGE